MNQFEKKKKMNFFINQAANKIYLQDRNQYDRQLTQISKQLKYEKNKFYEHSVPSFNKYQLPKWVFFGYDRDFAPIYSLYSFNFELKDLSSILLELRNIIQQQIIHKDGQNCGISLIYFVKCHTHKKKNKIKPIKPIQFSNVKESVIKKLQPRYFRLVKSLRVCHQGFLVKSLTFFNWNKNGIYEKCFDCIVRYIDSLKQLVNELGPLFQCELLCEDVKDYERSYEWMEIFTQKHKQIAMQNYNKKFLKKQVIRNKQNYSVFQYSLQKYQKVSSKQNIPIILQALIQTITQKHSQQQGIFRKSTSSEIMKKLQNQLLSKIYKNKNYLKQYKQILFNYDAHTIACFFKKFFTQLNPPLVCYELYSYLLKNKVKSKEQLVILMKSKMERINWLVFKKTMRFFRQIILKQQYYNKMSSYNMAVVFSPCIFQPKYEEMNDMGSCLIFIKILQNLLSHKNQPIKN